MEGDLPWVGRWWLYRGFWKASRKLASPFHYPDLCMAQLAQYDPAGSRKPFPQLEEHKRACRHMLATALHTYLFPRLHLPPKDLQIWFARNMEMRYPKTKAYTDLLWCCCWNLSSRCKCCFHSPWNNSGSSAFCQWNLPCLRPFCQIVSRTEDT